MALNAVVLPAPFGPITLVIVPGRTANETPPRALTPPNLTARSFTASPPAASIIPLLASPVERPRLAPPPPGRGPAGEKKKTRGRRTPRKGSISHCQEVASRSASGGGVKRTAPTRGPASVPLPPA